MIRSQLCMGLLFGACCVKAAVAAVADEKAGSPGIPTSAAQSPAAQNPAGAGTARVPSARVLGVTESALEYCNRIDPSATIKLELQKRKLIKGLSQPALEKVRNSDAYRQAFAAESDFVAKVDEHNAKRICTQPLAKSR